MKILFHFTIALLVLSLVACNQTKSPEPVKQYTFIGGKEGDKIDTTSFDSLQLSDPFILADEETQMYYLVGSGGSLWKSTNLKMWTGPYQYITVDTTSWIGTAPRIWAPELHKYKGKYYCFVTFTNPKIIVDTVPNRYNVQRRATHILTSNKAAGPYHPISGTDYLPEDWSTLDGSFWEEDGVPYMVFCHEWMQTVNGMINYIRLAPDLSEGRNGREHADPHALCAELGHEGEEQQHDAHGLKGCCQLDDDLQHLGSLGQAICRDALAQQPQVAEAHPPPGCQRKKAGQGDEAKAAHLNEHQDDYLPKQRKLAPCIPHDQTCHTGGTGGGEHRVNDPQPPRPAGNGQGQQQRPHRDDQQEADADGLRCAAARQPALVGAAERPFFLFGFSHCNLPGRLRTSAGGASRSAPPRKVPQRRSLFL